MFEKLNDNTTCNKVIWGITKASVLWTLLFVLSSCEGGREKFLQNRAERWNRSLYNSSNIYEQVALEENAQQDAKTVYIDDPILNQEIQKAHERSDKRIKQTEKQVNRTAKYQEKLVKLRRNKQNTWQGISQEQWRLDPDKLKWIKEAYQQSWWTENHWIQ